MEMQIKDSVRTHAEHKVDINVSQNLPEEFLWKPAHQVKLLFKRNIISVKG